MRSDVVDAARRYLGVPFHHQGRVPAGVDCAGLLILTARDLGLDPIDCLTYAHDPDPVMLAEYLEAQPFLARINPNEIEPGDIVLMCLSTRSQRGHHLAIITDVGLIHAYAPARMVVETVLDASFKRAIVKAYRWQS